MASYGKTLETNATPDRVWRLWSDVSTWPQWNPDVKEIEISGPFADGTTGTMTTRSGGSHAISLEEVQPGRSFQLETSVLPLTRFAFVCEIKPSGEGRSTISQTLNMRGPLGPIFSAIMGKRIANGFEPILGGLKKAAEEGS